MNLPLALLGVCMLLSVVIALSFAWSARRPCRRCHHLHENELRDWA